MEWNSRPPTNPHGETVVFSIDGAADQQPDGKDVTTPRNVHRHPFQMNTDLHLKREKTTLPGGNNRKNVSVTVRQARVSQRE